MSRLLAVMCFTGLIVFAGNEATAQCQQGCKSRNVIFLEIYCDPEEGTFMNCHIVTSGGGGVGAICIDDACDSPQPAMSSDGQLLASVAQCEIDQLVATVAAGFASRDALLAGSMAAVRSAERLVATDHEATPLQTKRRAYGVQRKSSE